MRASSSASSRALDSAALATFGPVVGGTSALTTGHFDDLPPWNYGVTGKKVWFAWNKYEGEWAGFVPDGSQAC